MSDDQGVRGKELAGACLTAPGSRPSDQANLRCPDAPRVEPSRVEELEAAADEMLHVLHNAYFRLREFGTRYPKTGQDGRYWQIFDEAYQPLWLCVFKYRDLLKERWAPLREIGEQEAARLLAHLCDRDRSGEAGQTAKQAGPKARARAEGIAQPLDPQGQPS